MLSKELEEAKIDKFWNSNYIIQIHYITLSTDIEYFKTFYVSFNNSC